MHQCIDRNVIDAHLQIENWPKECINIFNSLSASKGTNVRNIRTRNE